MKILTGKNKFILNCDYRLKNKKIEILLRIFELVKK